MNLVDAFPPELIVKIVKLTLVSSDFDPSSASSSSINRSSIQTLLCVCKPLTHLVKTLIYHNVVLHSPEAMERFTRTVMEMSQRKQGQDFLRQTVRGLVILCTPSSVSSSASFAATFFAFTRPSRVTDEWDLMVQRLKTIVGGCKGLKMVALPGPWRFPVRRAINEVLRGSPSVEEIILQSMYEPLTDSKKTTPSISALESPGPTRLRVCEPGDVWSSPLQTIAAMGVSADGAGLEHLHLARRIDANEDNDVVFVDEVVEILSGPLGKKMKKVVVSLFGGSAASSSTLPVAPLSAFEESGDEEEEDRYAESHIGRLLANAHRRWGGRIEVRVGAYGAWCEDWAGEKALISSVGSLRFWG